MSLTELKKAVKKSKRKDTFENGAVVRWTHNDRYTYAAIKTPVGWVSTSRVPHGFVPKTMTFNELLDVVARPETSNVEVASVWITVQ